MKNSKKQQARHTPWRASASRGGKRIRRKDAEITRLRRELASARRENARLVRELSDLRRRLQATQWEDKPLRRLRRKAKGIHREERLLDEANRRAGHYRKKSFLSYLWESVMDSAPVAVITKLLQYLRRLRVVQIILSLVLAVGAVVAVALLSAAVIPFLFFGTAFLGVLAALRSRRMNRVLAQKLAGKQVRVMIPARGKALTESSFFIRNARAMAAEDGVAVLVVSPYLLSRRGLGGSGAFFTARRESENLFLVRRHYFFILRRRVLDVMEKDITVIC